LPSDTYSKPCCLQTTPQKTDAIVKDHISQVGVGWSSKQIDAAHQKAHQAAADLQNQELPSNGSSEKSLQQ
jgi:hypothetical protein